MMANVPLGGMKITPETRKRMSDSHLGQIPSAETIMKRSSSLREAWARSNRRKPNGFIDGAGYLRETDREHDLAVFGEVGVHRKVLYEKIGTGPVPCHWGCGRILEWGGITGIIPDHLDGNALNNDPENLVPCCTSCNMRRGRAGNPTDWTSQVTHCPQGHEYSPDNTYTYRGGRSCKECSRDRTRQWRRRRKQAVV